MSWATDILSCINDNEKKALYSNNNIYIGKVLNVNPLEVEVNGQVIKKHIYINTAYQLLSDNTVNLVEQAFNKGLSIVGDVDGFENTPKFSTRTKTKIDKHIEVEFAQNSIQAEWYEFLKEFHKRHVLIEGDKVILLKNATDFYVMSKVVKV